MEEIVKTEITPLLTEIQWNQAGKVRREQFAGRTPDELRAMVDERLRELREKPQF